MGFKPIKTIIQVDSMDDALRNGLWNALTLIYWRHIAHDTFFKYHKEVSSYYRYDDPTDEFANLISNLWVNYFKRSLHDLPGAWKVNFYPSQKPVYEEIRGYFFSCEWYEVYDFVEFIPNNYTSHLYSDRNVKFLKYCNYIMEREVSAYRFVNTQIVRVTSEEEIASIEEAIATADKFTPVSMHMKQALDLLADRKSPDYRNSIKESISAVESLCSLITENNKATLGQALKKLDEKVVLHPSLKKAFDSLYGYTSDADGIRHALLHESNLEFEDAKFMLVACSAFINYLKAKLI
jgi:hypothetical protein